MTNEQKAKAYDEVREKIALRFGSNVVEEIFSEFEMSEDERIRKALISILKSDFEKDTTIFGISVGKIIAHIEKQGEKLTNPRYENLEELLVADDIYQMSMNDAMIEEAKSKAINALSELGIGKLLGLEKQGEQRSENVNIDKMVMEYSQTKDGDFGLPVNCMVRAYRQGINDVLTKQGLQFPANSAKTCKDDEEIWSEKDEKILNTIINDIQERHPKAMWRINDGSTVAVSTQYIIDWLKSLKERFGCEVNCTTKKELKPIDEKPAGSDEDEEYEEYAEIKPKFKVDDWIVDKESKEIFHIEKKLVNTCKIVDVEGNDYHIPNYTLEEDYDVWTIQDAKNGDVLARNNDILSICIFAHFDGINNKYSSFLCHCGLEGEGLGQILSINGYHDDCKDYVPATKEQCNLLFQKIKEAGYEWDDQRKQLDNLLLYKKN